MLGLLMLVREFEPGWRTALIVGHNPGLAELTAGLAGPDPEPPAAYPTAFVAVLGLPGPWAEAAPGEARLLDVHRPRAICTEVSRQREPGNRRLFPWSKASSSLAPTGLRRSWSASTIRSPACAPPRTPPASPAGRVPG